MPRRNADGITKPPQGTPINRGHPLAKQLAYAYVGYGRNAGRELAAAFPTAFGPGTTAPTVGFTSRFGMGWANDATNARNIQTALTPGWTKNQTYYSVAMLCKVLGTPGAAAETDWLMEGVSDAAGTTRFKVHISNGLNGTTGIKWGVTFRTGLAASTARNVNAGAGGTVVAAGQEYVLVFTFDSVADLYTLYLNGRQEAQLAVAESAIANTDPAGPPFFLSSSSSTGGCNGVISAVYVWQGRVLTPNDVLALQLRPYGMFDGIVRRVIAQSGRAFTQALTGTLSFVGAETNRTSKVMTGALSFVGAQSRAIAHGLTATLNFVGATAKRTSRALTGGLSFVGAFTASHLFVVALTATLSFVGAQAKQTNKSLTATLSFIGACAKFTQRALTATLNFTGSVAKRTQRALTATLNFVGSLAKLTRRALTATLDFVGVLATALGHAGGTLYTITFTATVSFVGAIGKRANLSFDGTLGTSGSGIGRDIILVLDNARTRLAKRLSAYLYSLLD